MKTRRDVIKKTSGAAIGAGALGSGVYANPKDREIKLALVGCGGRGTGAVRNAIDVKDELGPIKLYAMADVLEDNIQRSYSILEKQPQMQGKLDVSPDRRFVGFDGYKKALDALDPGDVAIFTTPCAFRWPMFEYAVEKGIHCFMEKPLTTDGFSGRMLLEINKKAKAKNLKVGVGLMCRHCVSRNALLERVNEGDIGEIQYLRSYRMQGPIASAFTRKNPGNDSSLIYQIKNFHSFLWLSGGSFSDFYIHGIDECCMIKGEFPVRAQAVGGRHYRDEDHVGQNFDSYSVEYTFADGTKLFYDGRNIAGHHNEFAAYAHGTKGSAVISSSGHVPARSRIYSDQNISKKWRGKPDNLVWAYPQEPREPSPLIIEWEALISAIRYDEEFNEVDRGVAASMVTSMGRMAAHTGQEITYDQILNSDHVFALNIKELSLEGDSPLMPDDEGFYPIPEPGIKKTREY